MAQSQLANQKRAPVRGQPSRAIPGTSTSSNNQLSQTPNPGTLNNELVSLYECPVCFETVSPPIIQCQAGHLVCARCRPKLTFCPTCRGTLGNVRNLAMEKIANNFMFPCKHIENGCRVSVGFKDKVKHEEICEFGPWRCPCPGDFCSWQGQLDKVMNHVKSAHQSIETFIGEDIVFVASGIHQPNAYGWIIMQSCFGHHFMFSLMKKERQFFAIVQLIGSRKQAQEFVYRLQLNRNRRRLSWETLPRSSHEGVASAISNCDCLVFDTSVAQVFAENNNLCINITISMVHE